MSRGKKITFRKVSKFEFYLNIFTGSVYIFLLFNISVIICRSSLMLDSNLSRLSPLLAHILCRIGIEDIDLNTATTLVGSDGHTQEMGICQVIMRNLIL